jgi:hypothetical protein
MWTIPRITVSASAAALLLSGCAPTAHIAGPAPQSISTPIFANEDEALAAATKAYAAYVKVSDEITADGGVHSERIAPYVTRSQLIRDKKVFENYKSKGYISEGTSKFHSVVLQAYSDGGQSALNLVVYLCLDLSHIRLMDSSGSDITPQGLETPSPMQITLARGANSEHTVVIERSESWSGDDFCQR